MLNEIALTILRFAVDIFTLLVVLRLLMQLAKADFYNPISQFVVKATNPFLLPLRKFIPGFYGIDFAAVVLALIVQAVGFLFVFILVCGAFATNPLGYLTHGFIGVLNVLLSFYLFAIFILVIVSWVSPGTYHPGVQLLNQILDPVMRPVRNLLPTAGGLDFSPMLVLLGIYILRSIVLPNLSTALGVSVSGIPYCAALI